MNDYLERLVYDSYARKHHSDLIKLSENSRLISDRDGQPKEDRSTQRSLHALNTRTAFILALAFLAALLITQVVVAAINVSGGGGPYLVK